MQQRMVDHLGQFFVRVLHGDLSFRVTARSGVFELSSLMMLVDPSTRPLFGRNLAVVGRQYG
jgi:hypothetical protein